ncbi:DUF5703 domain-containing protein [Sphingomonas nostoxanthinifaciens]|uniref:DUF5703 domain-containing protein n=1 Tax=Sphingomonas nostoxanthinifaciens TaxID=2872652 RepID=UPI001CC1C92C|nr:DUF5703 domain-containing protein [Sphingomonas nostoxanthinifaciens]UAK23197.1 DUF5703 domain-containing protein [Sphingomonas nostoxanthinifaciens]
MKQLAATAVVPAIPPAAAGSAAYHDEPGTARRIATYNPVWTSPSDNAGASMPCGAGDIGLNVWVEGDDILFYIARSGAFDETNSYLKLGRVRLRLDPSPFASGKPFRQELRLLDGEIEISCNGVSVTIWADAEAPVVHVACESAAPVSLTATFESWRTADRDYLPTEMSMHRSYDGAPVTPRQYADATGFADGGVVSLHRNRDEGTVFDLLVEQQGMGAVRDQLWNPLSGLTFGTSMRGDGLVPAGQTNGRYASTDFTGWTLASAKPQRTHALRLYCHVAQAATREDWLVGLRRLAAADVGAAASRARSRRWWRAFWSRSYIMIEPGPPGRTASHGGSGATTSFSATSSAPTPAAAGRPSSTAAISPSIPNSPIPACACRPIIAPGAAANSPHRINGWFIGRC